MGRKMTAPCAMKALQSIVLNPKSQGGTALGLWNVVGLTPMFVFRSAVDPRGNRTKCTESDVQRDTVCHQEISHVWQNAFGSDGIYGKFNHPSPLK